MVTAGYNSATYGDYIASATTLESIEQASTFPVNQKDAPNVDSYQSVNNVTLVNGTGPESGSSSSVESSNAIYNLAVTSSVANMNTIMVLSSSFQFSVITES
ncbi:unnamed protein product [Eruca vesicaria subsp. sativa]|uniref:Uncharacterized protein n=1 Tax=Eruca vesicaria subsp. sativa TaxID=29727 RepID=A0ABC8KIZ9_ERUVS|nr:unnamed protein product [Eruca vesicaria subsp. sativa]